jgi:tetratricopeptide (TPR) repeat protein
MPASSPRYDQSMSVGRFVLDRGDLATAERELRVAVRTSESLDVEHVAELVKLAELQEEIGASLEAETLLRRALEVGEEALGATHFGLVPALRSLGALLLLRGATEQVEPLLTRALAITEQHLGADHPNLVPLLTDLTRLYLERSAYDRAEPLLRRLLAIKRSTGEDRPEVATILATLATVRQALGRHEAAEQLWRRVLEIRERTLPPNHFAIGTTLEHLADSCAARGKLAEALTLFQRAHALIELTLGAEHASLVTLRERIADLQLQAAAESLLASSMQGVLALQKELDALEEREARGRVRSMGVSIGARLRVRPIWVAITALTAAVVSIGLIAARTDAAGDGGQSQFAEGFARVEDGSAARAAPSADSSRSASRARRARRIVAGAAP